MVNTPFNYAGNKFLLLEQILPLFDYKKDLFFDVFAGGGSVYTNVLDRFDQIIVNDVIEDLIGIHKALLTDDGFVQRVIDLSPNKNSQDEFVQLRQSYNQNKSPEKLYALILSCTNNLMRFNKSFGFNQTWGKRSFNPKTLEKIQAWVQHVKPFLSKIVFMSQSFVNIDLGNIDVPNTMFYFDPPYYNTEAGYNAFWSRDLELKLYSFIRQISDLGGSIAISGIIGDHKEGMETSPVLISLIKDGFTVHNLNFDYEKVARNKKGKTSREVLITNYH